MPHTRARACLFAAASFPPDHPPRFFALSCLGPAVPESAIFAVPAANDTGPLERGPVLAWDAQPRLRARVAAVVLPWEARAELLLRRGRRARVRLWLPPNYDVAKAKYPLLLDMYYNKLVFQISIYILIMENSPGATYGRKRFIASSYSPHEAFFVLMSKCERKSYFVEKNGNIENGFSTSRSKQILHFFPQTMKSVIHYVTCSILGPKSNEFLYFMYFKQAVYPDVGHGFATVQTFDHWENACSLANHI
ncbi:Uncharacterized protein GBIM_04520, partial [Gryllus bimaculatus]